MYSDRLLILYPPGGDYVKYIGLQLLRFLLINLAPGINLICLLGKSGFRLGIAHTVSVNLDYNRYQLP